MQSKEMHLALNGPEISASFLARLWQYQKERFPIFQHVPLIVVFTFSAASFSRICRGEAGFIPINQFVIGSLTAVMFFMLLRIADEFKDFAEDSKFRPYRAVPRGLVTLRELMIVAVLLIVIQICLNALFMPRMLVAYGLVLVYLGIMSKEFFVAAWLKRHPVTYMLSHMFIMPMIDLYTTGLDWIHGQFNPPSGLLYFLIISFSNGIVIEIGRKIRAREAEEKGVETYSYLYGEKKATLLWICIVLLTLLLAIGASISSNSSAVGIPLLIVCALCSIFPALLFLKNNFQKNAAKIEIGAAIWTLCMYLILGATPMVMSLFNKIFTHQ